MLESRPAQEPVGVVDFVVVDFVNDKTGFEDNHVGNHGIVDRIGIFGDVDIFLHDASRIGEEGQWAATPLRYSLVSGILSVLIVTNRQ
jgi:hypothetical protein